MRYAFASPCQNQIYRLFKAIIRVAKNAGVPPYALDKLFWLIGSVNFYDDPEIGSIGSRQKDSIEFALQELVRSTIVKPIQVNP